MSTIRHDRSARQFSTEVDGQRAHLDYLLDGKVMRITHTRVPEPIANLGIAAELMRAALAAALAEGWTVDPVCSYAKAYLAKHPDETAKGHVDALLDEALDESFPASDSPSVGGSN